MSRRARFLVALLAFLAWVGVLSSMALTTARGPAVKSAARAQGR